MDINNPPHKIGYFSLLGFKHEPFSTSPDPEFFYHTREHDMALTNLLIELRLRRGLSVIFGDIGTGKTTLSRKLVHELNKRGDMIFHMILDPEFRTENQFLISLVKNFGINLAEKKGDLNRIDIMDLKDEIEKFLISKTLEEKRTIILIIDEAQKLDLTTLETLRMLLNFETNDHKLIQLVLLGQLELYAKVVNMANFMDRISFKYTLNPLGVKETSELINFRIAKAGYKREQKIFLDDAVSEVFNYTKGYPRKINMLCHKILKELVMNDKYIADAEFVRHVIAQNEQRRSTEICENLNFENSFVKN
ncbi:MAG: AAA family ATPase [Candidatus Omnitrophica bacterium]|nr:AAA family ATPase [Candidatus Omnitrophota bacterium]